MATKETVIAELAVGNGCLGRSQADEPVFVLCARDRFAAQAVRRWADAVELATHPDSSGRQKAIEARAVARAMDAWRESHGGGKVPD